LWVRKFGAHLAYDLTRVDFAARLPRAGAHKAVGLQNSSNSVSSTRRAGALAIEYQIV
jgi:hypothetical protein